MLQLDEILKELGCESDTDLANRLGKHKSTVSKWRVTGEIPAKAERELLALLSAEGNRSRSVPLADNMERPEGAYDIPRPSSKIPIISWAQAGPGGYYEDAYVSGFGDINRPYDVNDQNAYALIISGDSMSPKFEPGDIVIVSPAAGVQTGDYAVIKLVDGQVLAKRVKAKNGRYVLESVNPDYGIIDCPAEEVLFMHRIVWVKQRG